MCRETLIWYKFDAAHMLNSEDGELDLMSCIIRFFEMFVESF